MSREKVYVVDEEDNVIGEKWRDELLDSDCWRLIAIWIENSAGDILLQQRSLAKDLNPGLWTPAVVGTVSLGETYEECAYKELSEEVGVVGVTLTTRSKAHYKASTGLRNIQTFECKIDKDISEFTIQKEEVEQIRWITADELTEWLASHPEKFTVPGLWGKLYGFPKTI